MEIINQIIQFILGNVYLKFLSVLLISVIAALLVKLIFSKAIRPVMKRTKTKIDDIVFKSISSIVFYIIILVGLKVGFQYFESKTNVYNSIVDTLFIVFVAIFLIRIINNIAQIWLEEWKFKTKTSADERLIPIFRKILSGIVIVLAVIFIFSSWKIDISPLLATAGIAGLAIGLAVKDSLANILGGLQLVFDRTFKVGDKVMLESGELGVILDIGLRSTKLKTYDNEVIYIPNGILANAKIKNYTVPDLSIRVNVDFGVVYGSDPEKVKQVVIDAVKKIDAVLDEPEPVVQFLNMSDFSLDFVARAWVKDYNEAYYTKLEMTDAIYEALKRAKIEIPFPTRTVYTKEVK